jgi:hypothetical protein
VRKWNFLRGVFALSSLLRLAAQDPSSYSALAADRLQRAQENQAHIQALVDNGTLAPSMLLQAREQVADVQDQATLSATLYSETKLQDLTTEQATAMVEAAERRRDRQASRLAELQKLLQQGIIARAEMGNVENELAMRQHVVDLAHNRVTLLEQLRQMASEEQRLEHSAHAGTMEASLIRYDGKAPFSVNDLPAIEKAFELRFHRSLPVSAMGQSVVHQTMGLDHRNRVDVALNPELPEGLWLRQYLEAHKMPYLAFRNAVTGAATGAHIHIGPGSSRLKAALLPHPPVG